MRRSFQHYGAAWIALSPSILAALVCFYGCILWMVYISFTRSKLVARYDWAGLIQYERLMSDERWHVAMGNLLIFGLGMIVITLAVGFVLAVFLDQRIRLEGVLRTIYMYPLALSFVVTGLAWQWLLNPDFGIQKIVRDLGFRDFEFNWLASERYAIFAVLMAAIWHGSGLVMAILLAGLRNIDADIWRATRLDGVAAWRVYLHIVLPMLMPVITTCVVLQSLGALRAYDIVVALTGGGPGFSSDLPGKFVIDYASERGNLGLAAAAAVEMLLTLTLLLVPTWLLKLRQRQVAKESA